MVQCPSCGSQEEHQEDGDNYHCQQCGYIFDARGDVHGREDTDDEKDAKAKKKAREKQLRR